MSTLPTTVVYQPPKQRSARWLVALSAFGMIGPWCIVATPSIRRAQAAGSDWPALLPGPRFVFLDRLTRSKGKPIAQVLREMNGYTVWEGTAFYPPTPAQKPEFPSNFTGTLRFANNHDWEYTQGYYWIAFEHGIATKVGISDD